MECRGVRRFSVRGGGDGLFSALFGRRLALETWFCPSCGKVELFAPRGERENLFDLIEEDST
jgi:hypothetical protein